MLLAGLFYHSYMFLFIWLVGMYDVRGYYKTIHVDVAVVQSVLSRLAENLLRVENFRIRKFYVIFSLLKLFQIFFLFRIQKTFVKVLILFRYVLLAFSQKSKHGLLSFVSLRR